MVLKYCTFNEYPLPCINSNQLPSALLELWLLDTALPLNVLYLCMPSMKSNCGVEFGLQCTLHETLASNRKQSVSFNFSTPFK